MEMKLKKVSQQKMSRHAIALAALAVVTGAAMSSPEAAQAHRKDFAFVKEFKQPTKGERELELYSTYSNSTLVEQIEVDYGVTDRFSIAPYIVFEREKGESLKYHEFKLEGRYQLTDYKPGKFLPALYLEYAKEKDGPSELEGILIFSRYTAKGDNLSFNLIAERELESGAETEKEYAVGYSRALGKKGSRVGLEWVQSLEEEKDIHFGPTVGFAATDDIWLVANYSFAVNNRDTNNDRVRLLAEYEF